MSTKQPTGIRARHSRACTAPTGGRCTCRPSYEAFVFSKRDRRKVRKSFPTLAAAKAWRADATRRAQSRPAPGTDPYHGARVRRGVARRSRGRVDPQPQRASLQALGPARLPARPRQAGAARARTPAGLRSAQDRRAGLRGPAAPRRPRGEHHPEHARPVAGDLPPRDPPRAGGRQPVRRPRTCRSRPGAANGSPRPPRPPRCWTRSPPRTALSGPPRSTPGCGAGSSAGSAGPTWTCPAASCTSARSWDAVEGPIAGKTRAAHRTVPIVGALAPLLARHKLRTGRDGDALVFGATAERPFEPSTVRRRALTAWNAAQLDPITLHEGRHTFASLMIAAGVNAKAICEAMGHASVTMTFDRYGHLMPDGRDQARERMDAFLGHAAPSPA